MSHLRKVLLISVVIVMNATLGLAQPTRIEQDDPSITYSGNWFTNGSESNSGGAAALANNVGTRAVITFTGTSITWIGVKDPWAGMATVLVDGTPYRVDSYADTTIYQTPLFKAESLSIGPHTLSIEITHERDEHGRGAWVWIDAFDIENGGGLDGGITATVGRVEDNNPALVYSGNWYVSTNAVHSGGAATLAVDAGARVTVNFNGSGVAWVTYRDEWSGLANIYLDGNFQTTLDAYMSPWQSRVAPYRIEGLPPGDHSLTIEVTGTHNESSHGAWVWVDAFDVEQ